MTDNVPARPAKSFRVTLQLERSEKRLDNVLLQALRDQSESKALQDISRTTFKGLFNDGKVFIKGQRARPSSALAAGTTYVDILGY